MDRKEIDDIADALKRALYSISMKWKCVCDNFIREQKSVKHKKTNNYQRMKYNKPYKRKRQLYAAAKHRRRGWHM